MEQRNAVPKELLGEAVNEPLPHGRGTDRRPAFALKRCHRLVAVP